MSFNFAIKMFVFFFSSRRRHTRFDCDWSSDVCSSDLEFLAGGELVQVYFVRARRLRQRKYVAFDPRRDVVESDAAELKVCVSPVEFKTDHTRDAAAPRFRIAHENQASGTHKIWARADAFELKLLALLGREAEMCVPDVGCAVEILCVAEGAGIEPRRGNIGEPGPLRRRKLPPAQEAHRPEDGLRVQPTVPGK